jgi:hypothetical protein
MLHHVTLLLFAFAGGLTFSGLVVTCYRLLGTMAAERNPLVYYPVIMFAGASVLMENVLRARKTREADFGGCVLAAACSFFWSSMLGLLMLGAYGVS